MESITLLELNNLISGCINRGMKGSWWVQAEISSLNTAGGGHCYMELVQKDQSGRNFLAKTKATAWSNTWNTIRSSFERATGQRLQVGMKVLLLVTVNCHAVYGLSLYVQNIDPTFTIGDMARRRREILAQLESDGVIDLNRELPMPVLPQRVAIVSSATAAGYGDFCNQLAGNVYGFHFETRLFPALMQGDGTEASVIAALNTIARQRENWDVVVIIRGGGSVSELSCFDSYMLALNIANFPLPVITGIGHERDDTVADVVAHTKVKTPTAAAELLISMMFDSAQKMENLARRMTDAVQNTMNMEKLRLQNLSQSIPSLFSLLKERQEKRLVSLWDRMVGGVRRIAQEQDFRQQRLALRLTQGLERGMTAKRHRLDMIEEKLKAADPQLILKRGYSISMVNGHAVKSASDLRKGDRMVTRLFDGSVESEIVDSLTK